VGYCSRTHVQTSRNRTRADASSYCSTASGPTAASTKPGFNRPCYPGKRVHKRRGHAGHSRHAHTTSGHLSRADHAASDGGVTGVRGDCAHWALGTNLSGVPGGGLKHLNLLSKQVLDFG
jgi:hypothetical protein